jgi:hypothetical protein
MLTPQINLPEAGGLGDAEGAWVLAFCVSHC